MKLQEDYNEVIKSISDTQKEIDELQHLVEAEGLKQYDAQMNAIKLKICIHDLSLHPDMLTTINMWRN